MDENRPHEDQSRLPPKTSAHELREASLWPLAGWKEHLDRNDLSNSDDLQSIGKAPCVQSIPPPLPPPREQSQSFSREDRVPKTHSPKKHGSVSTYPDEISYPLSEFVAKFSKDFPIQVRIIQGFYGESLEGTLTTHDKYTIIRVSNAQVVCIETTRGYSFDAPIDSAVQFSLLYNPCQKETDALNGYTFETAADIIETTQLPRVVCTTVDYHSQDSRSSVEANEILAIRRVTTINNMRKLEVFSLRTRSSKLLEDDCAGHFSTKPSLTRMYLIDIRNHVKDPLPSDAVIYFAMEVPTEFQDQPGVIKMSGWREKRTLIASPEEHTGDSSLLVEIPLDGSLSDVEVVVVRDGKSNAIYDEIDLKKFNFTNLVPWKRNSEEADVISNVQQFFNVTLRKGYQSFNDHVEVPSDYEQPYSHVGGENQSDSTAGHENKIIYTNSEYTEASSLPTTPIFHGNKTLSPELLTPTSASAPTPESSSAVELILKRLESIEHRLDRDISSPPHDAVQSKSHSLERNVSMQRTHSSLIHRTASVPMHMPNFQTTFQEPENRIEMKDLKHVMQQLTDLSGWYMLGVFLDIPKHKLDQIQASYGSAPDGLERCKVEMITFWMENSTSPPCSWSILAAALYDMGKKFIARRIADVYGVMLPYMQSGQIPLQLQAVMSTPEERSRIAHLRRDLQEKDELVHEVEEHQKQLDKQMHAIQGELVKVDGLLQFTDMNARKLIRDESLICMAINTKYKELQNIEQQMRFTSSTRAQNHMSFASSTDVELQRSDTPHDTLLKQKRDEIARLVWEQTQVRNRRGAVEEEQAKLKMQLMSMESKVENVTQEFKQLQKQKQKQQEDLKQHEESVDGVLVSRNSLQRLEPEKASPEYYNVIMCDGKMEIKLRKSEVDMLENELREKDEIIQHLSDKLQYRHQKLLEVGDDIQKQARSQHGLYSYTNNPFQNPTFLAMNTHQNELLSNRLRLQSLQCKIEVASAEVSRLDIQTQLREMNLRLQKAEIIHEEISLKVHKSRPNSSQGGMHVVPPELASWSPAIPPKR